LRSKLLIIMMVTSACALLLAVGAFMTYEWSTVREDAKKDVEFQADLLSATLGSAVEAKDRTLALKSLETLSAKPQFSAACVFNASGSLLATYPRSSKGISLPASLPPGAQYVDGCLKVYRPVFAADGKTVGTVFLQSDFRPVFSRFRQYLSIACMVMLAAFLVAFWMASLFQGVISQPILDLTKAARQVSEKKDYSLRVNHHSRDEVGELIANFNDMLAQIQSRDAALREAQNQLENRVAQRTKQLAEEVEERKRIEEALDDEKERLDVTLRSIADGVIATDPEGRIVSFNASAERFTGWGSAEAAGQPLMEVFRVVDERSREMQITPIGRVLEGDKPIDLGENLVLLGKDGAERTIAATGAPIQDHAGRNIGVVLVFRDVTEKRQVSEELLKARKLESIGMLAGGIAHDFNNILTAITGNISLARMCAPNEGVLTNALEAAEKAAVRAKELTQQLLTFSKGGAPVKKLVSVVDLVKDTAEFVIQGSKVRCQYLISPDIWPAELDPSQVGQVVHNLVLNAVQAMPWGGNMTIRVANIRLTENSGVPLPSGNYVVISVQDRGAGIPPDNLPKIFDPYFSTKRKGGGLGLATSYSIIKRHEGHISVRSLPGQGTTFDVYLPAAAGSKVEIEQVVMPVEKGEGRILVMDDEVYIRELATALLTSLGYETVTSADGAEAIRLYQDSLNEGRPYAAVVLDLTIPGGMSGKDAIQELRRIDPNVKAIVCSGYYDDPVISRFKEYGFDAVVSKPYSRDDIGRALQTLLKPAV
jgi:PAS domain S-box-containing protein